MCFDKNVSINTFLIGLFTLFLMKLNENTDYSNKYNLYTYLFFLSILSMQLLEYFIWSNLENKNMNQILSLLGLILIISQPLFGLLSIEATNYIIIYLTIIISLLLYKYFTGTLVLTTTVNDTHLQWN